jgi:uncharacterized protein (UPF0305 family)
MLNRILGNRQGSGKGKKEEDDTEHFTTLYQTFLRRSNKEWQDRWIMYHMWEIRTAYRIFVRNNKGKRSF